MSAAGNGAKRGPVWPWLAVSVTGIALIIGAQVYFARIADDAALSRDRSIVETGVEGLIREIAEKSSSVALWDDAVLHLENAFDLDWAKVNVGTYFGDNGFDAALVFNGDNAAIYQSLSNSHSAPGSADVIAAASPLLLKVRQAEAARGPADAILVREQSISEAIDASAVSLFAGRPFVLNAALVQPDFGKALPAKNRSAVIVTAKQIDDEFVSAVSKRFLLARAHLHVTESVVSPATFPAIESGEARTVLRDGGGRAVAAFDWRPPQPGKSLLTQTLAPVLLGLTGLAAWAGLLYVRGRRATEGLIASEARAAHMAYHDALTGLPNRALLGDRMAHALAGLRRSGRSFAVHCIDLDRFKDVNDTFGHEAGDDLIRKSAGLLSKACRQIDTLARLGGDEFAIIQMDATPEAAAHLADRIVKSLAEPIDLAAGRLFIGASIGVSIVSDGNIDPAEGLRQADLALYRAKDAGRGRYAFFDSEMDASVKGRRALQDDLRAAMTAKALELHYQPQVNVRSEIVGLEALVRWKHPQRGPISPAVFVPLAEESGLIDELGMFTLRRAFEDSRRWPHLKVAVNVSATQLRRKDFVSHVEDLVTAHDVDPRNFELEITEGLLLGDDAQTHDTLNRLRALGFQIALDDFGTGYSSLSYLQKYPIDKIKIDRSFITNLGIETEADAVVHAIVRLARALGLSVIAEGVETESQRQHLTAVGCGNVQGYLFGKPASAADILTLLAGTQAKRASAAA
ncbi:MAG: EAL domain-containing protein [Hyphomonadaceae bacterium]